MEWKLTVRWLPRDDRVIRLARHTPPLLYSRCVDATFVKHLWPHIVSSIYQRWQLDLSCGATTSLTCIVYEWNIWIGWLAVKVVIQGPMRVIKNDFVDDCLTFPLPSSILPSDQYQFVKFVSISAGSCFCPKLFCFWIHLNKFTDIWSTGT